jgi:hypothetical protein
VTPKLAGTKAIKGEMIIYPPGTAAANHHHEGAEHFMYVLRGRSCNQGVAGSNPGCRPLTSYGKCKRSLPRCGATIDARDPRRGRGDDHQSGAADLRGKAAISGLFATPGRAAPNHLMLGKNWKVLELLAKARFGSLRDRLAYLKRSCVYRQTLLANLVLIAGATLKKI